jgi:hypothetical protein
MYGFAYALIVASARDELAVLNVQMKRLTPQMATLVTEALHEKRRMVLAILVTSLLAMVLEALCQYLYAAPEIPFLASLFLYEFGSLILFLILAVSLRPQPFTAFIYLHPTSLDAPPDGRHTGPGFHDHVLRYDAEVLERIRRARIQRYDRD